MYKIKNDDIFKILPIIDTNGKILPIMESRSIFLPKYKIIVYDNDKKILSRLFNSSLQIRKNLINKYIISILINGEIKNTTIGKTLHDKIIDGSDQFHPINLKNNTHLLIRVENVNSTIGMLPSYGNSKFIEQDWKRPFEYSEKDEWIKWLRSGQIDMWNHLNEFDIKKHLYKLEDEFGQSDEIGRIMAEIRDERLDIVLNA